MTEMWTQFKFDLGEVVRDVIHGLEGVVTGRAQYLTSGTQYLVQPQGLDKDGKIRESYWLDEAKLELKPKAQPIVLPRDRPGRGQRRNAQLRQR